MAALKQSRAAGAPSPGRGLRLELVDPAHGAAIDDFNRRMEVGGSSERLSLAPAFAKISRYQGSPVSIESFVLRMGDTVRGGVNVKTLPFWVGGQSRRISFYNRPLSEGIVDARFAMVGTLIQKLVTKRYPEIYGLGVGSREEAVARLMVATGWTCDAVPFWFDVGSGGNFLRHLRRLQEGRASSLLAQVAARSGLAWLGLYGWRALQHVRGRRPKTGDLEVTEEMAWGPWADEVWCRSRSRYSFIGERSVAVLRALYPDGEMPLTRLRVRRGGRELGWTAVLDAQLEGHNHFGSMRLGSIVDALAEPEEAVAVVGAALAYLRRRSVDLVVCNFSHRAWSQACDAVGMVRGPSNFLLFLSKALQEMVEPLDAQFCFVTRGDGDGPGNLY